MNLRPLLVLTLVLTSSLALAQRYECATSLGVNCEAAIPEKGSLISSLSVLPGACAADARLVDVQVNVSAVHTMVGDLNLTLTHPSGRAVQVLHRAGLSLMPVSEACTFDDLDATFSDEASATPGCDFLVPAVKGALRPFNPLSGFDGLERNGVWQLTVNDAESVGEGALVGWSLELPCTLPPLPTVTVATGVRDTVEGSESAATVVFTRAGAIDAGLTVTYEVSGTAVAGIDFDAPLGQLDFAIGEATATLSFKALADGLAETTESVVVKLGQGDFTAGAQKTAGVNFVDVTCGDGLRTGLEACDDGNGSSGDGCSASCAVEPVAEPVCGDGLHTSLEGCDDGNTTSGDGCSESCTVEIPAAAKPSGCGCASLDGGASIFVAALLLRRRRVS